mmetsp:Transcript_28427/g.62043  ORF Transcript_28427/g.62043 Transcript_28427/m.62043 type:complete len:350 (+) Transcript_28427:376-1425(+)
MEEQGMLGVDVVQGLRLLNCQPVKGPLLSSEHPDASAGVLLPGATMVGPRHSLGRWSRAAVHANGPEVIGVSHLDTGHGNGSDTIHVLVLEAHRLGQVQMAPCAEVDDPGVHELLASHSGGIDVGVGAQLRAHVRSHAILLPDVLTDPYPGKQQEKARQENKDDPGRHVEPKVHFLIPRTVGHVAQNQHDDDANYDDQPGEPSHRVADLAGKHRHDHGKDQPRDEETQYNTHQVHLALLREQERGLDTSAARMPKVMTLLVPVCRTIAEPTALVGILRTTFHLLMVWVVLAVGLLLDLRRPMAAIKGWRIVSILAVIHLGLMLMGHLPEALFAAANKYGSMGRVSRASK